LINLFRFSISCQSLWNISSILTQPRKWGNNVGTSEERTYSLQKKSASLQEVVDFVPDGFEVRFWEPHKGLDTHKLHQARADKRPSFVHTRTNDVRPDMFKCLVFLSRQRPATHYQVDLTGTPDQVRLSGLPYSEWVSQYFVSADPVCLWVFQPQP
jgi:hypothetical protein